MDHLLYDYVERLSHLLRAEMRRHGAEAGLLPVQVSALQYLARCNEFSNSPLVLAEYLNLTKGTVSQTVKVLEKKGFLEKMHDAADKRQVRLKLTAAGRDFIRKLTAPDRGGGRMAGMTPRDRQMFLMLMEKFLRHSLDRYGAKSFGLCKYCRFHDHRPSGERYCRLLEMVLQPHQAEQICHEHHYRETA